MTSGLAIPVGGSRPVSIASSSSSVDDGGLFDDLAFLDQATASPTASKPAKQQQKLGWLGRSRSKKASTPASATPSKPNTQRGTTATDFAPPARRAETPSASTSPGPKRKLKGAKLFSSPSITSLGLKGRTNLSSSPYAQSNGSSSTITSFSTIGKTYPQPSPRNKAPRPLTVSSEYAVYEQYAATVADEDKVPAVDSEVAPVAAVVARAGPAPQTLPVSPSPDTAPLPSGPASARLVGVPSPAQPTTPIMSPPEPPRATLDKPLPIPESSRAAHAKAASPVKSSRALPTKLGSSPSRTRGMLSAPPRKNSLGPGSSPLLAPSGLPPPVPVPQANQAFAWGARRPSASGSERDREYALYPAQQASSSSVGERWNPAEAMYGDASVRDVRRPSAVDPRRPSQTPSDPSDSRRGSAATVVYGGRKLSLPVSNFDSHRVSTADSIKSPAFAAMMGELPRPPSMLPMPRRSPAVRQQRAPSSPPRRPSDPFTTGPQEPSLPESPSVKPELDRLSAVPPLLDMGRSGRLYARGTERHQSGGSSSPDTSPGLRTPGTPSSPDFKYRGTVPSVVLPVRDEFERMVDIDEKGKAAATLTPYAHEHARPESVMLPEMEYAGPPAVEVPAESTAGQVAAEYLASRVPVPVSARSRTTSQPESRKRSAPMPFTSTSPAATTAPPLPAVTPSSPPRPRRRSSAPHRCPTPTSGHRRGPSLVDSPPPVPQHSLPTPRMPEYAMI